MSDSTQLHATCIQLGGRGILLLGDSGSGKSDLALRLIDRGALLVADDRVNISPSPALAGEGRGGGLSTNSDVRKVPLPNPPPQAGEGMLLASPPPALRGLIEVRGVGILTLPHAESAVLRLAVRLVPREAVERLPEPQFYSCLGARLPLLSLHAFDDSTPAKIRLFLKD